MALKLPVLSVAMPVQLSGPSWRRALSVAVLVDEVRHALQTGLDGLVRSGITEANMLAVALHARTEMDIGQHRHAGFQQQALAKHF